MNSNENTVSLCLTKVVEVKKKTLITVTWSGANLFLSVFISHSAPGTWPVVVRSDEKELAQQPRGVVRNWLSGQGVW